MENKICITTTSKVPLKDTMDFINYHLNIGIDHIFIFFDNPQDCAFKILLDYKDVTCFKCDSAHWRKLQKQNKTLCLEERQQLNANFALEIARQFDYDWIIHMDTDELIYSKGSLKQQLNKINKTDVIRLLPMEAVPEKKDYKNNLREISLFKNFGLISRFYYSNKKLLQKFLPYFKKNEGKLKLRTMYFNGNAAGKSILSISAEISNVGMHEPISNKEMQYYYPKEISLLHFECKSFEDWKNKWLKVYKNPSDTTGYGERIPFLYDFFIACKNNDEKEIESIYKDFYFINSKKKALLLLLGLLKRIKLDKELFNAKNINKEHQQW